MTSLNDLHGKVPAPPVHVVALGFNGPWEVQTMKVRLATCRDRNVADYIAALWNLMPPITEGGEADQPAASRSEAVGALHSTGGASLSTGARPYRRRKAGRSVQVMP